MREIKFRAFEKKTKRMWFLDFLKNWEWDCKVGKNIFSMSYKDMVFKHFRGEIELMQYIESRDKDTKNIYEGDIVKLTHPCDSGTYEVVIHQGSVRLKCNGSLYYDERIFFEQNGVKVIGNKFENPELLKAKEK